MEILRERPHHAVLTIKLAAGIKEVSEFVSDLAKYQYPEELTNSFIESADKLKNGSAEIEITESGKPDYHCIICLTQMLKTPCQQSGRDPARNTNKDNQNLIVYNLSVGQVITQKELLKISKMFLKKQIK